MKRKLQCSHGSKAEALFGDADGMMSNREDENSVSAALLAEKA